MSRLVVQRCSFACKTRSGARVAALVAAPARRGFSSSSTSGVNLQDQVFVSTAWLSRHLPQVKTVDATWFIPSLQEDARQHFLERRVPGAMFFDIDAVCDTSSSLPHMLPDEKTFGDKVGQLGLSQDDTVIVYDTLGLFSAPRVWWTLRTYGLKQVGILDGGLPQWLRERLPTESGPAVRPYPPKSFKAKLNKDMLISYEELLEQSQAGKVQVVDARSAGRFEGIEPEPRPGCAGGHIPGSISVPFRTLLDDFTGYLKPPAAIKAVMERAGVDLSGNGKRIVTTCGSGVTATMLNLGLHLVGHKDTALYDGSWSEWGTKSGAPVEK